MSEIQETAQPSSTTTQSESKKKTPRCSHDGCRRKLGIVPFTCRCNKDFCIEHRASDSHACTFDYRAEHKKELLKTMSTAVVGPKVIMI